MNLIAIDTSAEYLSLAVRWHQCDWESHTHVGQQHAEKALPALDILLFSSRMALTDCDAIMYTSGPGAFTGLRIGCALAQGLAFSCNRPLLAIPTLDVLAQAARMAGHGRVLVCTDARMGQVYACAYDQRGLPVFPLGLYRPDELPALTERGWYGVGSGFVAHADTIRAHYGSRLCGVDTRYASTARTMLEMNERYSHRTCPANQAELTYVRDKVALTTQERKQ